MKTEEEDEKDEDGDGSCENAEQDGLNCDKTEAIPVGRVVVLAMEVEPTKYRYWDRFITEHLSPPVKIRHFLAFFWDSDLNSFCNYRFLAILYINCVPKTKTPLR